MLNCLRAGNETLEREQKKKKKKAAPKVAPKRATEKKEQADPSKPSKTVLRRERRKRNQARINEHFKEHLMTSVAPFMEELRLNVPPSGLAETYAKLAEKNDVPIDSFNKAYLAVHMYKQFFPDLFEEISRKQVEVVIRKRKDGIYGCSNSVDL